MTASTIELSHPESEGNARLTSRLTDRKTPVYVEKLKSPNKAKVVEKLTNNLISKLRR